MESNQEIDLIEKHSDLLIKWAENAVAEMGHEDSMNVFMSYLRIVIQQNNFSMKDKLILAEHLGLINPHYTAEGTDLN